MAYEGDPVFELTLTVRYPDGEMYQSNHAGTLGTWQTITDRIVPMLQGVGFPYITEEKILEEGLSENP